MSSLFATGLARLGLQLEKDTIATEEEFLAELLRWNARVNLTSIRGYDEAIEKHLLDSLLLLPHIVTAESLLDMGSGGGLPGIPVAIARPQLKIMSVDSVGKKINFQKHIKRTFGLANFSAQQSRIESLADGVVKPEKFDLVVSRAFSSLDTFLEFAAPLLKVGGRAIAMKGPEGECELADASVTVDRLGYFDPEVIKYKLPFSGAVRQFIILKK